MILWARRENTIGLLEWQALQRRLVRRADTLVWENEAAVGVWPLLSRGGVLLSQDEISELVGRI